MRTKREKIRLAQDMRNKAVKLYIDGIMNTKDVETVSRIAEKYVKKLKGA